MRSYNLLRLRDVLLTENETIAGFNEEKFPDWAKFLDTHNKYILSHFFHYRNMDIV